jgi:hypothetical protein
MAKYSNKTIVRDSEKSFLVKKVADMHNVSPRYVYYILNGERENDEIFKTYMDFKEGLNPLADAVKKLIPFN